MQVSIHTLNKTLEKTNEWLTELAETGPFDSKEKAYSALRAVLHTIRDRLGVNQAIHFAAEFPILLKGIYFDNWDPNHNPSKERTREAFLEHIASELHNALFDINPEKALQAVFQLLETKISSGAIEKVKKQLPTDVCALIDMINIV
jgi:uncharacterized protein (DUF2267 family)